MACSPLFLCVTMGFTDCQFFSSTTVPAADTQPPTTLDAVWSNGNYVQVAVNSGSLLYHIPLGTTVVAVSSAIDDGGVSNVTMMSAEVWQCTAGPQSGRLSDPIVATQNGGIGSTVSNGVWTGIGVTTPNCGLDQLQYYYFIWWTIAEDFHGNTMTGNREIIAYP